MALKEPDKTYNLSKIFLRYQGSLLIRLHLSKLPEVVFNVKEQWSYTVVLLYICALNQSSGVSPTNFCLLYSQCHYPEHMTKDQGTFNID